MRLTKFRVHNFRSIIDSTWIDCDNVTNIIGVNESGKSNALIALWKLNPAHDGKINLLEDLPRNEYANLKNNCEHTKFIEVYFKLDDNDDLLKELVDLTGHEPEELKLIYLARYYTGEYDYQFPNEKFITQLPANDLFKFVKDLLPKIKDIEPTINKEITYKAAVIAALELICKQLQDKDLLKEEEFKQIKEIIEITAEPSANSKISPLVENIKLKLNEKLSVFNIKPIESDEVFNKLISSIPKFVYYSNYGNLDSEIYLPQVIENLKRTDITGVAAAKARTLKVLFQFIGLNPQEILELGQEPQNTSPEEIKTFAKKRDERTVLLNSASSKLTKRFKEWWKQGNYIFDLRADGKFFKIWVSDEKRPEKIELESRSTGLQWFLSFYLIFLVETKNMLKNSILLLDEAGLSLHPLAQKDLLNFFKSLSEKNQIIHTTHSPFLVDTDNIDNVKIAYVNDAGQTVLSNNLRANSDPKRSTSIYAVHAALGLSVSDVLLNGCTPVIVEGPSDQYYFNAIKNHLISNGKFKSTKEIVFIPAGGVKGVSAIASIVSANNELPFVILDSDSSGQAFRNKLLSELYKDEADKIISLGDITNKDNTEVEDIIPYKCLSKAIDRLFNDIEDFEFEDSYNQNDPLLPQIEKAAKKYSINLPKGYKVELAKFAKNKILKLSEGHDLENIWIDIFNKLR